MSATQELADAVRNRARGTPYVVEETPTGFDVRLALEDPRWFGTFREWRLVQASVHHVRTEEATRTCTVEDELRTLTWQAGLDGRERPTLGATLGVQKGRVWSTSSAKTYTIGRGGVQKVSERTFDSGVGRRLVEDSVKELGWKQRLSLNEKIGAVVGFGTLALLVLAAIVVGVVALAGGFG